MRNLIAMSLQNRLINSVINFARTITGIYNWVTKNIPVYYLIILLFGYTAFSKLDFFTNGKFIDVKHFQDAMFKSPVLQNHVGILGYLIPLTELAICVLLAIRKTKLIGYYASLLLLCSFTGYIIYMFTVFPVLPCTCGGVVSTLSWSNHLILNTSFILFTAHSIYLLHKRR